MYTYTFTYIYKYMCNSAQRVCVWKCEALKISKVRILIILRFASHSYV